MVTSPSVMNTDAAVGGNIDAKSPILGLLVPSQHWLVARYQSVSAFVVWCNNVKSTGVDVQVCFAQFTSALCHYPASIVWCTEKYLHLFRV